jgi:hypothetical protein
VITRRTRPDQQAIRVDSGTSALRTVMRLPPPLID